MRLLLVPLVLLALAETARAGEISVMTWNVEWMWDGRAPEEGRPDFPWKGDPARAAARMDTIAAVIEASRADVVVLQEVENASALSDLASRLGPPWRPVFVQGRDTFTGQDVGLLATMGPATVSRFEARGWSGPEEHGVSKNLVARFEVDGAPLTIVGVHYLSRASDPSRRHPRQAQAAATLKALAAVDGPVILLGDLNDHDGDLCGGAGREPPTPARETTCPMPVTDVVAMLKARDPATPHDDLVNVLALVPPGERWTYHWDNDGAGWPGRRASSKSDGDGRRDAGELSVIDHILVDPRLRVRSARIIHSPESGVSDHEPVMATVAW